MSRKGTEPIHVDSASTLSGKRTTMAMDAMWQSKRLTLGIPLVLGRTMSHRVVASLPFSFFAAECWKWNQAMLLASAEPQ
jgi:hypothetical protein